MEKLSYKINLRCNNNVVVKLGGETSFDIYPQGWDKTYALKHFPDKNVWFVGDRCGPSGNDYEIYQKLGTKSYETHSTVQTQEIIKDIIMKINSN